MWTPRATTGRGLSPRAWGNRPVGDPGRTEQGSIPASTGKPPAPSWRRPPAGVYPREHGETHGQRRRADGRAGLSPRARGNLGEIRVAIERLGSIPASTGKPSGSHAGSRPPSIHVTDKGLSPRARGNPEAHDSGLCRAGSIPASTGKPLGRIERPEIARVYPREHGETAANFSS